MKQLFVLFVFTLLMSNAFCQKHGLIIGVGGGHLSYKLVQDSYEQAILDSGGTGNVSYKINLFLGYKYRLEPVGKRFFYDFDFNLGVKRLSYQYSYIALRNSDPFAGPISYEGYGSGGEVDCFSLSLNTSFSYEIISQLYVGIGIEPTGYYQESFGSEFKFDIPISLRVGYDFRPFDLALTYKFGICDDVLKSSIFESGRINDLQLSVFIHF